MYTLAHTVRPPLLRDHDDKSLEVGQCSPLLGRGTLLCPRRLLPLLYDSFRLNLLLDDTRASCTGEFCEAEGSECEMLVGERLSGHACCGSIDDSLCIFTEYAINVNERLSYRDTHPVMVNNLGNNGDVTSLRARLEEDNYNSCAIESLG